MKKWIAAPAAAVMVIAAAVPASAVTSWFQGFEQDTSGWYDASDYPGYGSIEQVASGTNGIASASGGWHAQVNGGSRAPFSRFAGYSNTWTGDWVAQIDVYLDPSWALGEGFDYSVAANGSDGDHQRDFIFHVTKDTTTGDLLVAGSNNTNFAPRQDLENVTNHYEVTTAGWYTLQHVFRNDKGVLAVDLNLLDAAGTSLFTETRTDPADTIPAEVGGNRYAWFTFDTVPDLAVDNHQLGMAAPSTKDDCKDGGWASYGFTNQGQCVASVQANENAGK